MKRFSKEKFERIKRIRFAPGKFVRALKHVAAFKNQVEKKYASSQPL